MEQAVQVYQDASGFSGEQVRLLNEMLKEKDIKHRKGPGGKTLSYVSGDYAIATANRIFGHGKWGYTVLDRGRETTPDGKTLYTADVQLSVLGCPFPFPGEGEGVPLNDTVEQHAKARKEAVTDALKRALRHFGDQFGLSLYNEDNFVEDESGNPVQVKDAGKQNGHGPVQQRKAVIDAIPTPAQLRTRCSAIGMSYGEAVKFLFKRDVADDELSPDMCATFDIALKKKEKSSPAGAGR
jgi:hypothetical protein